MYETAAAAGIPVTDITPGDLADLIGAPLVDPIATRVVHPSRATLLAGYVNALARYFAATAATAARLALLDARDAGAALDAYGYVFDADAAIVRAMTIAGRVAA